MKPSLVLFYRLMVRPLGRERLRTTLTIFAVSLGVAVVVAIELAGGAAAGSFRSSLESLTGKTDLQLTAVGGLDEMILAKLGSLPYPLKFIPRIDDHAAIENSGESVPLIGLDLVADPSVDDALQGDANNSFETLTRDDSIWVGPRLKRKAGDHIRLILNDRPMDFTVRGVLRSEGRSRLTGENLVVMDIGAAQKALGKSGRLDRIEVRIPRDSDPTSWESILRPLLPRGVTLERQGARTDENRKMLEAFRWNLRVLSYIALVVGAFLIYNTISVSVVRRRAEIGILRALGATRLSVTAAFLAEAALFGGAGSAVGLLLGRLMAEGAVKLLAGTVQSLYVSSSPAPIAITPLAMLMAAGTGIGGALAAALAPSWEAGRVTPVEAMARGQREYQVRLHVRRDLVLSVTIGVAGTVASRLPPVGGKPLFGYLAALLLISGSAFAIPAVVTAISWMYRATVERALGVEPMLASRSLVASLGRTSVLVGALSTAVAMMASVGIMVGSFRETVLLWMDNQLKADLFLRPAGSGAADRHPTLSTDLAGAIAHLPGVSAVDMFRAYEISYEGLPATLGAGDSRLNLRFGRTTFLPGQDRSEILQLLPTGNYVIVSEPFANKHHLSAGDSITLPLGSGNPSFRILGVYYDYSNERGYVIADRSTLLKYLPDPAPSNIAVYVAKGFDVEAVRQAVEQVTANRRVLVFTNRSLKTEAIRIFDRTFAITYALELVAIVVAVMGIAGALLALVIDRRRELSLLRFLGASTLQIRRLILFEAGFLGLLANLVGLALGVVLSLILIYVINIQSFGWTIQFHWPVTLLFGGLTLVYVATIVAGLYPARTAMRLNPIKEIHEE